MSSRVDKVVERMFARTEAMLDAIDAGDFGAAGQVAEQIQHAAPFDLAALGQASTLDFLDFEAAADEHTADLNDAFKTLSSRDEQ